MKRFALVFLVAAAAAAPQFKDFNQDFNSQQFISSGQPKVRILSQRFEQDQNGNYEYGYEQDNGQRVEEVGRVQPGSQPETGSISQQGSYEFVGDDGNTYKVSYVADENGFQPQGAHLPQPPAQIPEYEQLRRDYPQLFWAENGGAGIILNNQQQFNQQQFNQQQFDQQQFNQQQFDQQQFDQQQFDQQQFDQQQFDQQQFNQQQFDQQQFDQQQFDQPRFV
ncbi:putative mediator of RNA polymerase II transcription subunit 12 [Pollicipes pollicipes]|uniref:putative mediator of RNA polymerase II transcription subunit 12 n=1 Tax=Pollicipes pollicipes TaxID=41117 RepID=UPI0018855AAB|nr:putative mediator of RNA polymerase II transcription subunit 12 [Pollicipes pollicipes]